MGPKQFQAIPNTGPSKGSRVYDAPNLQIGVSTFQSNAIPHTAPSSTLIPFSPNIYHNGFSLKSVYRTHHPPYNVRIIFLF